MKLSNRSRWSHRQCYCSWPGVTLAYREAQALFANSLCLFWYLARNVCCFLFGACLRFVLRRTPWSRRLRYQQEFKWAESETNAQQIHLARVTDTTFEIEGHLRSLHFRILAIVFFFFGLRCATQLQVMWTYINVLLAGSEDVILFLKFKRRRSPRLQTIKDFRVVPIA